MLKKVDKMDLAIRKSIMLVITVMVCLFSVTLVAMDKLSDMAADVPVSAFDVGTLLSKTLTEFNNIDSAQRYMNFAFIFKIEIEPRESGPERIKQYSVKVVAVDEKSDKEYGEKVEHEVISNIKGCSESKCIFYCSGIVIKKDESGICIQCYDKRKEGYTGSCEATDLTDLRMRPCPYADRTSELEAIKTYMEKYSRSDIPGISDEELLALLKSMALKESTFMHCKDGKVIVGPTGDIGLMQINPNAHTNGDWFVLEENIKKAREIISDNLKTFRGYKEQERLAVAAYNCGNRIINSVVPEYESDYGKSAKEAEWKDLESIVAKYCLQGSSGLTTADHVNAVMDSYMNKYMNSPQCYNYVCA